MSRGEGGHKGYEFWRMPCPCCGRKIAVSFDADGRHVWFRRHKPCGRVKGARDDTLTTLASRDPGEVL